MQQMAPDIFVRILRGMGACRKKPAQPASGTLSWMTPSETLLRLCLGGFGKIFAKQRLLLAFCPVSRAHFRDRKTLRKRVHHKGPPLYLVLFIFVPILFQFCSNFVSFLFKFCYILFKFHSSFLVIWFQRRLRSDFLHF